MAVVVVVVAVVGVVAVVVVACVCVLLSVVVIVVVIHRQQQTNTNTRVARQDAMRPMHKVLPSLIVLKTHLSDQNISLLLFSASITAQN